MLVSDVQIQCAIKMVKATSKFCLQKGITWKTTCSTDAVSKVVILLIQSNIVQKLVFCAVWHTLQYLLSLIQSQSAESSVTACSPSSGSVAHSGNVPLPAVQSHCCDSSVNTDTLRQRSKQSQLAEITCGYSAQQLPVAFRKHHKSQRVEAELLEDIRGKTR